MNFPLKGEVGHHLKKRRGSSSRFRGVSWNKAEQKWKVFAYLEGKNSCCGSFDDEESAARAYDAAIREFYLRGTRPKAKNAKRAKKLVPGLPGGPPAPEKDRYTSEYVGVAWSPRERKWIANLCHGGRKLHVGTYPTAVEAARARDAEARRLKKKDAKLNFPGPGEAKAHKRRTPKECNDARDAVESRAAAGPRKGGKCVTRSQYVGVYFHKSNDCWQARLTTPSGEKYLGSYSSELAASHMYDDAVRKHRKQPHHVNHPRPGSDEIQARCRSLGMLTNPNISCDR